MGEDAGAQAADGVTEDGTAGEVSALQARHHGHVGGQVAAPAHAHGGEDGNVLCPGQTGGQKAGHQANGRPSSAQGRNGDGNAFGAGEAKQRLQDEGELLACAPDAQLIVMKVFGAAGFGWEWRRWISVSGRSF